MQLDAAASPESRDKLKRIARYQRWVLVSLLINVLFLVYAFTKPDGEIPLVLRFVILGAALFNVFSVFMVAKQFMSVALAVILALLQFIPLVALLVLFFVNQKATTYLQQRGVKVGLLGAKADALP
jgi:hypothetical protein